MESDTVLFEGTGLLVTNARVVVHDTTYAVRNITSVRIVEESIVRGIGCGLVVAVGAGIVALVGLDQYSDSDGGGVPLGFGLVGLVVGLLAMVLAAKQPGARYWVAIGTSGAEQNAVSSFDRSWAQTVVAAVTTAITSAR
jgi:hypothetical protein